MKWSQVIKYSVALTVISLFFIVATAKFLVWLLV